MLEVQYISFLTWAINELRSSILKMDLQGSCLSNKLQELSGAKWKFPYLYGKELDIKTPEITFELMQLARFPLMFIGLLFGDHRPYEVSLLSSSGIFALMQTLLRILGTVNFEAFYEYVYLYSCYIEIPENLLIKRSFISSSNNSCYNKLL